MRIISFLFIFFIISCGQDKLNPNQVINQISKLNSACNCSSSYSPVCGNGQDFDNICIATECHKATNVTTGHCDCKKNQVNVCGVDNFDHSECEAIANKIEIKKFIPCSAYEID